MHNHFTKGAEFDTIYQRAWSHVEEDRKNLATKLSQL